MNFAKKSLGQNFLIDKNICKKIVNLSTIYNNTVIEIGPGTGNLTNEILEKKPKKLILIEKDKSLYLLLKKKYENIDNIDEEYFPHSSLIKHYKSSDLYLNLSRIESFGITYLESLASTVPIISFKSIGSNEVIVNGLNGFFIDELFIVYCFSFAYLVVEYLYN